jgi:NAD(P)-dependent dehydrogenase (short-subunit alcohol dehydrogenase family)
VNDAPKPTPTQLFRLDGQCALVIGGTSGIGKSIAAGYIASGAKVVVAGKNLQKLEAAREELGADGYGADASDLEQLRGLIRKVLAACGRIDVLVNCQGTTTLKPAEDFTPEDFDYIVATNLRSVFFACTEVGRHMLERGSGSIVNIGSLSSYRGWPRSAIYGLTKAAVVNLTESLATEWAGRGVRVNAIAPGFVMTDLNRDKMSAERKATAVARTPMMRFGETDDMVGAAIYLASAASSFVTGETIRVDGGFLAAGL